MNDLHHRNNTVIYQISTYMRYLAILVLPILICAVHSAFAAPDKPRSGPVISKDNATGLCTTSSLFISGILDANAAQKEADCLVESLSKSQVTAKYAESYLEMAYLSDAAYKSGGRDYESNWSLLESYTSQRTGLDAKVFKNKSDGTVVVAFGGTADSKDVSTDISQFVLGFKFVDDLANTRDREDMKAKLKKYSDQLSPQYKDALDYVKGIQKNHKVAKITGHSLGGGLAQYVAAKLNLAAVTFNPAGLSGAYIDLLQSCGGKKGCGKNITNIIAYAKSGSTEGISGLRRRVLLGDRDKVSGLGILLGNNLKLTITDTKASNAYELHKIGTSIEALKKLGGETVAKGKGLKDSITGMEFVSVKGGCFQMGDTFGDGYKNEKPVHEVCLSDFAIGKYEVTQGQWKKVMGNNPSKFNNCGDNCPVEWVSWEDVQQFIVKLNGKSGKQYRLPTEAEWEYACRSGGKNERYCGGNDVNAVAWYESNSDNMTHPVGQKLPNGLGIYDMSGNVREWVQDLYNASYPSNSQKNPTGPSQGVARVVRDGGWNLGAKSVRAFNRGGASINSDLGFRLVAPVR